MANETEKVEVKRIEQSQQNTAEPTLFERFYVAIFPIIGGLILDFADLATFGPIGIYLGMAVGCTIGWLIGGIYEFSNKSRIIFTLLAGIYCMIPGTFYMPIATVISAVARFNHVSSKSGQKNKGKAG